jgi:hypothetical protein
MMTFSPVKLIKNHPNVTEQKSLPINSMNELRREVLSMNCLHYTGILVTQKCGTNINCMKIVPKTYTNLRKLRGDEANLKLRYLELIKQENNVVFSEVRTGSVLEIKELYPEKEELFDEVENNIKSLLNNLINLYNIRKRNFLYLPQELHIVLENIKKNYSNDKSLKKNIEDELETFTALKLNSLMRCIKNYKKDPQMNV